MEERRAGPTAAPDITLLPVGRPSSHPVDLDGPVHVGRVDDIGPVQHNPGKDLLAAIQGRLTAPVRVLQGTNDRCVAEASPECVHVGLADMLGIR